jgi:hypothetical protein
VILTWVSGLHPCTTKQSKEAKISFLIINYFFC